jgi:hypothetical protein
MANEIKHIINQEMKYQQCYWKAAQTTLVFKLIFAIIQWQ